jgi:hypothetical protein
MNPTVDNKQELGQRAIDSFEYLRKKLGETRFINDHTFSYGQDLETGAANVIVQLGLIDKPGPYLHLTFLPRVLSEAELQQLGNRPRMHARSRWFRAKVSGDYLVWDEREGVWYECVRGVEGTGPDGSWYGPEEILVIIRGTWRVGKPCAVCGGELIDPTFPCERGDDINFPRAIHFTAHSSGKRDSKGAGKQPERWI